MYIDFNYYEQNGGASITDASVFYIYEARAEDMVDSVSFNRLNGISPDQIPEKVRRVMVQLVDLIYDEENTAEVASETNENMSVVYVRSETISERGLDSKASALFARLANVTVNGQKLLYRGVE